MYWLTILVAIGFGIARLAMPVVSEVHREDLFKDFAHLFVGAMFGASVRATVWFVKNKKRMKDYARPNEINIVPSLLATQTRELRNESRLYWALFVGLTALEVFAFYIHKA